MTLRRTSAGARWLSPVLLLGLLAGALPLAAAPSKINSMSFSVKVSMKPAKRAGQTAQAVPPAMQMNVAVKGRKMAMDMPPMGKMISTGTAVYQYSPTQKTALQLPAAAANQMGPLGSFPTASGVTPAQMKAKLNTALKGAKKVGSGSANGHKATIYQTNKMPFSNQPLTNGSAKVWIADDMAVPFPVRMIISGKEGTAEVNFLNIKLNPALSDSLFVLPAGTKITKPTMPTAKPQAGSPRPK